MHTPVYIQSTIISNSLRKQLVTEAQIQMATPSQPPGTVVVNTRVRERKGAKESRQQGAKETSIKAVLLGDYGAGKTTLFKRIREEELLLLSNRSSSWSSQSMDLCNLSINTADKKKVQVGMMGKAYKIKIRLTNR